MAWYLPLMESRLNEHDKRLLQSFCEPRVVGVPPVDTWRDLCVAPDGEIRYYGFLNGSGEDGQGQMIYLASRDCGLSWQTFYVDNPDVLGSSVKSPFSGKYLRLKNAADSAGVIRTWALVSEDGPAAVHPDRYLAADEEIRELRLPIPLCSRKRWLCAGQTRTAEGMLHPVVLRSDDDGITWAATHLLPAPKHEIAWPHQGRRWQNPACEATLTELGDGTIMALARTSQDFHYLYYSHDGGESWTDPVPSRFHGTLTMPTLFRLSDGRLLLFWCNTQPLPELDHNRQWPPMLPWEISGEGGEDVFTNRDANHAAISEDDGQTWIGFREIFLNLIRNDSDFRSKSPGYLDSLDKSVHQFQALELPFGKVLLSFGQHHEARKMVIFDPQWLYETEQLENFRFGLGHLSTQVYLKSNSGNFRGFTGHCSWNRTHGAVLVPDPTGNFEEVLQIARIHDPRLFSEVQGAVWNFPASNRGELKIKLRIDGEGVRVSVTDRWFNPCDPVVGQLAQLSFAITREMLIPSEWSLVRFRWDLAVQQAEIVINDMPVQQLAITAAAPNGFSYLHLQSLAENEDYAGTLIKKLEKCDRQE
ncbi:MAG TPA: exo-alpha-sialidase [Clostridiales bacterium]|nr:exo-alpha-sialidase [Clostridiales bacterium]